VFYFLMVFYFLPRLERILWAQVWGQRESLLFAQVWEQRESLLLLELQHRFGTYILHQQ
jgi:hypothetical protein